MKTIKLLVLSIMLISFFNCEDDGPNLQDIQSVSIEDLYAPQEGGQGQPISGTFARFDFETCFQSWKCWTFNWFIRANEYIF